MDCATIFIAKESTYQLPLLNVQTQEYHPLLLHNLLEVDYTSAYHLSSSASLSEEWSGSWVPQNNPFALVEGWESSCQILHSIPRVSYKNKDITVRNRKWSMCLHCT